MKLIKIAVILALSTGIANAEYSVLIPLEQEQGGQLPTGTIVIKPTDNQNPTNPETESWIAYDTEYGSWINQGTPYDCSNWTPDESTISSGVEFEQTATDCTQTQTRTVRLREIEETTGEIRYVGSPSTETQNINNQEHTRIAYGTMIECYTNPSVCFGEGNGYVNDCSFERKASIYGQMPYAAYWFHPTNEYTEFRWDSYMISANPGYGVTSYNNPEGGIFYRGRFIENIANSYSGNYYEGEIYEVCYYGPAWDVGPY